MGRKKNKVINIIDVGKENDYNKKNNFGVVIISAIVIVLSMVFPFAVFISAAAQVAEPMTNYWKDLPKSLNNIMISERNVMYDSDGVPFAETWDEDRTALKSLNDVSDYTKKALIDTEDSRFYEHDGLDVKGTLRAALKGGGGSGITQQLVKNLQFYNMAGKDKKDEAVESTYSRKIRELKLSLGYEESHSKDEILLAYFNTVAFGSPNIYSIESASKYFFNKPAKELNLAESAALVGTVQNPNIYNMDDDSKKDAWKERQKMVLERMVSMESITQQEADKAYQEDLAMTRQKNSSGNCSSSPYPFYCEYVLEYLRTSPKLGETQEERDTVISKGGLSIKTYMDRKQMDTIDKKLENDFGNNNRVIAPTALVNPKDGGVSGFGFNRNYGAGDGETLINWANNPAATGSTFKMITLAAALESGMSESELQFSTECPFYPGSNYDAPAGGFRNSNGCGFQNGLLNYKQATAWSSNTWYVTLATKVGMKKIYDMSRKLGLTVPDSVNERSLSYVLGATEQTPIQMANAFGTFANKGIYCPATPVKSYTYADGTSPTTPETYQPKDDSCRRIMSPKNASAVLKAMRANTYPGEVNGAFGTRGQINGLDAVGKTGTNQNYNYAWSQVSTNHSIFTDVYDPTNYTQGVYNNVIFKGSYQSQNIAMLTGPEILSAIYFESGEKSKRLDYDNTDSSHDPVPVENKQFFTIPSVIGMKPAEAMEVLENIGIKTNVSKETRTRKNQAFPTGVVMEQSFEAGTQLPEGTSKEMTLYLSE